MTRSEGNPYSIYLVRGCHYLEQLAAGLSVEDLEKCLGKFRMALAWRLKEGRSPAIALEELWKKDADPFDQQCFLAAFAQVMSGICQFQ